MSLRKRSLQSDLTGAAALAVCLAASPFARAHDVWLEPDANDFVVSVGHHDDGHMHAHEHGHGHNGDELMTYDPDRILAARCRRGAQTRRPALSSAYPVRLTGPCDTAAVWTSSGYWSKTPYGTKPLAKDQTEAIRSWRAFYNAKRVLAWRGQPFGMGLELVAQDDPLALGRNETLALRVLFDGEPVAGATVNHQGEAIGRSDADGVVELTLHGPGTHRIVARVERPADGVKADIERHAAAYMFDIPAP